MPGAHVIAAERRVVKRLRRAGALSPNTAQPLSDLPGLQRRRLAHLLEERVVHEVGSGSYYLDEEAWSKHRGVQRRRAALIFLLIAIVSLLVAVVARR